MLTSRCNADRRRSYCRLRCKTDMS